MLRGVPGLYSYGIFERQKGWPDIIVDQVRIVFKLNKDRFRYMAISDKRQRWMPLPEDIANGEKLAYPEAVHLRNPSNPTFKGQVDDKYQYSCDNKDNTVHGWVSNNPSIGFWMITPSHEFFTAGPLKQVLTSHVGPVTLGMFVSGHYAGEELRMKFEGGEEWKKVFGPVFIYLNSGTPNVNPWLLWQDAQNQMLKEIASWPYNFPLSEDFHHSDQRGMMSGQLFAMDRYISKELIPAKAAYVGLASYGDVRSWQWESKGYQFWTEADNDGNFWIKNVRVGNYNLYVWVPGFIGDYKFEVSITIQPGSDIKWKKVIFWPERSGPTLWEIGIPDRSAAEFYVPDPKPWLTNPLYNNFDRFRQYGLWDRYTEMYPNQDLIYTVGVSNYSRDWFFAHVTRNLGNDTYQGTTWQIKFELNDVDWTGNYTLRIALASANGAELQVRINDPTTEDPIFTTGLIGRDNAIARHGIHGIYRLYRVNISGTLLFKGTNTIFLRQSRGSSPFLGLMYDYIRFEAP